MTTNINLREYIPVIPQGPTDLKYDGITPLTQTLPQVAQLEIKYAGPLVKDSVVEKLEDLINPDKFSWALNYIHRRVWVKEYACEYYLDNGDGKRLENWKRAIGRMVVNTWSPNDNYQAGDIVNYFGKLYVAKENITLIGVEQTDEDGNVVLDKFNKPVIIYQPGPSPLDHENLWQVVTGEIETYTYYFGNVNQIQIFTEIRNPHFEVFLGEPWLDENGETKINPETKLPVYKNIELVEACIIQGQLNEAGEITQEPFDDSNGDLTEDSNFIKGGVPYIIRLYNDEILTDDKTYYDTERLGDDKKIRQLFSVIVTVK